MESLLYLAVFLADAAAAALPRYPTVRGNRRSCPSFWPGICTADRPHCQTVNSDRSRVNYLVYTSLSLFRALIYVLRYKKNPRRAHDNDHALTHDTSEGS